MDLPAAGPEFVSSPRAAPPAAEDAAALIHAVFDSYHAQFRLVTRRARARFAASDWIGAQQDAIERLTLYRQFLDWVVRDLESRHAEVARDSVAWVGMKAAYARLAAQRDDTELAYTFFNSVSRRVLHTVGVRPEVEFTMADFDRLELGTGPDVHRVYGGAGNVAHWLRQALAELPLDAAFLDLNADAALAAAALSRDLGTTAGSLEALEVLPVVFYRNKGAYVVGRLRAEGAVVPLVMPLVNTSRGILVDAVLTTSDEVSIVFGFTRSYFHVDAERLRSTIEFLRSIMPKKPMDELYTSIGYHKHGKTELHRSLQRHLAMPETRFEIAEGDEGLVMSVFVLSALNVVFKVIKDRFGAPKNTTRHEVMDKYNLVFVRDRVGRLADAQEFEGLEFRRDRFAPDLLEKLLVEAGASVKVAGARVIVRHLYTERRVTPLNLYLRQADPEAALDAVLDYGQAIKDLAAANIFTGDMLLKNFGVTRHGRVIFYDYDELCLLTECNFRELPTPRTEEDEYAAEPWFYVGERDVFPAEFKAFLVLPGGLGDAFMRAHGDLMDVAFWRGMQARQQAGEVVDFFPYKQNHRLRREEGLTADS